MEGKMPEEIKEVAEIIEQPKEESGELRAARIEIDALKNEVEALKNALNAEKANALIKQAEAEGKLLPSMTMEGSGYLDLAFRDPALFERIMAVTPARISNNNGQLTGAKEPEKEPEITAEQLLIDKANKIMADKNVDFAEALRLAHLEK